MNQDSYFVGKNLALNKDYLSQEELNTYVSNLEPIELKNYVHGYLAFSQPQEFPYSISGLQMTCDTEEEFLNYLFEPTNNYYYEKYKKFVLTSNVKKTVPEAIIPTKNYPTDSGLDLYLIRKIKEHNGVHFYGTGISVKPPNGFYFDVVPRSSISKMGYILANSIGIIDSTYTGEIIVALIPIVDEPVEITFPFRMCQLIPRHYIDMSLKEVDSLEDTTRGDKGFGSSGTN